MLHNISKRHTQFFNFLDVGYKCNLLKKFTFLSLILNFSHTLKDSIQARIIHFRQNVGWSGETHMFPEL
jgi:hypothetical protein